MNHEEQHELDGPDEPLSQERYDEYEHDLNLGLDKDQVPDYPGVAGSDTLQPTTKE